MADSIVQALLRRCAECWEDNAGADIGVAKLDALTTLGFLTKRRAGRHGNVYTFTDAGHAELEVAERAGDEVDEAMSRLRSHPDKRLWRSDLVGDWISQERMRAILSTALRADGEDR
ncbi:hypothetical protein [Luteimonas sp. FCS-9]|uniref:hypothetical protein n=1 Tax=Luteimonas sp. FCS-9 TaxID=1547516 RepID=UPI00063EAC03|nr:hypothetical protein [Luteimonas sp. FCS-9]KLJ02860.1 hypothetical protein WQ56_00850 [Luteimonas sp. FCS-9]